MLHQWQEENNNGRRSEHQSERVCVCHRGVTLPFILSIYTWSFASRLGKQTHTSEVIVFHFRTSHLTSLSLASLLSFPHRFQNLSETHIFVLPLGFFLFLSPSLSLPSLKLFVLSLRLCLCLVRTIVPPFLLLISRGLYSSFYGCDRKKQLSGGRPALRLTPRPCVFRTLTLRL